MTATHRARGGAIYRAHGGELLLVDTAIERLLAAHVLAEPQRFGKLHQCGFAVADLGDFQARAALGAACNVAARDEQPTLEAVRAELQAEHDLRGPHRAGEERRDLSWLDEIMAKPRRPDPPIDGWVLQIRRFRERRETAIRRAETVDVDRADNAKRAAMSPAKPRWVTRLTDFIGTEEPDDNDSEDWIIRDIIPRGEPALLVGPPKSGKTWAALDLAISVAYGTPWLGGALENTLGRPGRVLCILLEDSLRRLGKRLWQLCRPRGICPNTDPVLKEHLSITRALLRLPDKQDEREFAAELKRWKPDLVIVDNLTRVMVGDQDRTGGMAPFTKLWIQMCADIGAAIDFLHHTGKAGEWKPGMNTKDVFELIRGSSDLLAAARNAVVMFPIRAGDGEDVSGLQMSDVRIRSNLDLRRESLVLGFERTRGEDGRWSAQLRDLGDVSKVRAALTAKRKEENAAKRKAEVLAEKQRRRELALDIARRTGACSSADLAAALDLTPRAVAPVLTDLVQDGVMAPNRTRGYVLAGGGE